MQFHDVVPRDSCAVLWSPVVQHKRRYDHLNDLFAEFHSYRLPRWRNSIGWCTIFEDTNTDSSCDRLCAAVHWWNLDGHLLYVTRRAKRVMDIKGRDGGLQTSQQRKLQYVMYLSF